jgi:hypothetical protein
MWTISADIGVAVLALVAAVEIGLKVRRKLPWRREPKVLALTTIGALLVIIACWLLLPSTAAYVADFPEAHSGWSLTRLADTIEGSAASAPAGTRFDLAWVRTQLAHAEAPHWAPQDSFTRNALTDEPLREEDSPGNYTIRETSSGMEYTWYDTKAGAHTRRLDLRTSKQSDDDAPATQDAPR